MSESIKGKEEVMIRSCLLCGADNHTCAPGPYSHDTWMVKTCPQCSFTYLENAPFYQLLDKQLAWERTSHMESDRRVIARPRGRRMSEYMKQFRRQVLKRDKLGSWIKQYILPGNVLDIGCGTGHVLEMLPESYQPYGIEISDHLAQSARKRLANRGGNIIHDNAIEGVKMFAHDFFTGILMSAFLEHESNPAELLKDLYPTLKMGGRVIIKVPNFACWNRRVMGKHWCGFRYPDHVNYFTPSTLKRLVLDTGYQILRFYFLDRFPLSDNMWMLLQK